MRDIPCPLCDSHDRVPVCSKQRNGTRYTAVRCGGCGFHYVNPEPDQAELLALYDEDYSDNHGDVWHGFEDRLNAQVIAELSRRGVRSLFDLGAGQGRFVSQAAQAGIRAEGVEPSAPNRAAALEHYRISLSGLTVQQFLATDPRDLECITMLNVLEHLPAPLSVLRQVAAALRPGGTLALVVPNVDFTLLLGRIRRMARIRDVYMLESPRFSQQGFDPPIHLSSFDAAHMRDALARAGFDVDVVRQAAVIRSAHPASHLAKHAIAAVGRTLEFLTSGTRVWGYSLLAIATRPH